MKVAQQIELSLSKTRVEKLIVCLGFRDGAGGLESRGALATRVSRCMLQQCRPSPSDIHDPNVTRAHARDRNGRARSFYEAQTRQAWRGRRVGADVLRSPQTWDSSRVVDFMGVWCDRLLLGDARHPARCALLEPRIPEVLWGEAVARVAQCHRHLPADSVLLAVTSEALPFGVVQLRAWQDSGGHTGDQDTVLTPAGTTPLRAALQLFPRTSGGPWKLCIGIGAERGLGAPLTAEETSLAHRRLVPLCSFASALWSANPDKARAYVEELTNATSTWTEKQDNPRLWRTMQHAMLSTRDAALLSAYFSGTDLDARLSRDHTRYLAETLLRHLADKDHAAPE